MENSYFQISTHKNNFPTRKLLVHSFIVYFLISILMLFFAQQLWVSFSDASAKIDIEQLKIVPIIFFVFGLICLILGIRNILIVEEIMINKNGVLIKKGKKYKKADWMDIIEIRNNRTFYPNGRGVKPVLQLKIKTKNWKHTINVGNFTLEELKKLFNIFVQYSYNYKFNMVNELEW